MKVLSVLSESHRVLFENYFMKTIPCPEDVFVKQLDLEGDGTYGTDTWQKAVNEKTRFVVSFLNSIDSGTYFIFSDIDVQFFPAFSLDKLKNELDQSKKDILFQKEVKNINSTTVNSGFYIAKSSPRLINFFEEVLSYLENLDFKSDQRAINILLQYTSLKWGYLSFDYYARTHGFPPPISICCHHANKADNVEKKIKQFELVREYYHSNSLKKIVLLIKIRIRNKIARWIGNSKLSI